MVHNIKFISIFARFQKTKLDFSFNFITYFVSISAKVSNHSSSKSSHRQKMNHLLHSMLFASYYLQFASTDTANKLCRHCRIDNGKSAFCNRRFERMVIHMQKFACENMFVYVILFRCAIHYIDFGFVVLGGRPINAVLQCLHYMTWTWQIGLSRVGGLVLGIYINIINHFISFSYYISYIYAL